MISRNDHIEIPWVLSWSQKAPLKRPVINFRLGVSKMHPVLEYSCVALGLGLGYTRGGTLGSLVLLSSILAGLHLYMQVILASDWSRQVT